MSLEKRKKFDNWHAEHLNDGFNLKEQLALYCVADVKLLSAGLVDYRQMLLDETGIDALRDCTTLASTAMTHFRKNIMQANTIGIASELSYERHDRQSSIGLKFLKWIAKERGVEVQYADSAEGEKRLWIAGKKRPIQLDGYVDSQKLAIEVNG